MYLIGTDEGLFKLKEKELERIADGYAVNDVILPYVCSPDVGVISIKGQKIIKEGCWRLYKDNNTIYASIEGPKIYEIKGEEARLVLDLTKEGEKLGWEFPHGPPHITDFAVFKGNIVATVEEGNLLVGETFEKLKPLDFFSDMHNLLVKNDTLFIATAYGVYVTRDLKNFEKVVGGYAHGLEDLGDYIVLQVMSQEPLLISKDGIKWEKLSVKLPRPTFGENSIAKMNERNVIYSTTAVYQVDIVEQNTIELVNDIPLTRRIKVFEE